MYVIRHRVTFWAVHCVQFKYFLKRKDKGMGGRGKEGRKIKKGKEREGRKEIMAFSLVLNGLF